MIPKNPKKPKTPKKKSVFIPQPLGRIYQWQEDKYRIDSVTSFKKFHDNKRKFLTSKRGQVFLSYRKEKFTKLHGLDVWLVYGKAIRAGLRAGDVDFTMGGHGYRYLYIPQYEIWIDQIYKKRSEIWPIIWHEYLERILMIQGKSYIPAHNIASRLEIVLRDGNYFVLPIGTYRQRVGWTCGPAALKIVLDFLRWPVSESYLARLCKTSGKKGTDPDDLVRTAKKLGFNAEERGNMTISEVKGLIKKGLPVIANYQYEPKFGEGHYAVIVGFSKDEFILSDPMLQKGYQKVNIKEFMQKWYELEDKTVRQGIIVNLA